MPDLAPRCGYRWQHAIGHAGHLDLACDLPAGHHPKMHSAPNPDLPRLYYVDPDVAPEVVDSGQCYLLVIVAVLIVAFAYSRPTERGDS